jgi:hypothetical protein
MAKLKLLVDSYDQPQKGDKPSERHLEPISKGQLFEPVSDAERDRLVAIGAALDPKEAAEKAQADAQAEVDRLKAQQEALEAQIEAAQAPDESDLESLTVPELKTRAEAAGVEGFSELRKQELIDAVRDAEG